MVWSPERRELIVARYHLVMKAIEDLSFSIPGLQGEQKSVALKTSGDLSKEMTALAREYREGLDFYDMGRCPFTGNILSHSFDPYDLRGMWWRSDIPYRPEIETKACPTFVALTGAVQLAKEIERTEYLVLPGPGLPFVLPKLLGMADIRATVFSMAIGKHTGFAVAYFSTRKIPLELRPTIWGTEVQSLNRNLRWDDYVPDNSRVWDFNLAPWINAGKLAWIAPGDKAMTLRTGDFGCPYLGLTGVTRSQFVSVGTVTVASL